MSAQLQFATINARWYAPLLKPVLPSIQSALKQLEPASDPWALPRTGLGGSLVMHVAKGFGARRWRRAGRVAVIALEGYNQRIHLGGPTARERARWLERDIDWARRAWEAVLEEEGHIVRRVMDRVMERGAGTGDRPIPEMVLFLRAAVAAGVVVGDVSDELHAALDRYATWLGILWEHERGRSAQAGLPIAGWQGALAAVGLRAPYPPDVAAHAREAARAALDGLPEGPARPLIDLIEKTSSDAPACPRDPACWQPVEVPQPARRHYAGGAGERGELASFSASWLRSIDEALLDMVSSRSRSMRRATEYLVRQGGKRLRPLMVLAAAQACEGAPGRGLAAAATVEWMHVGSLILDDIIDEANLRRGLPALHVATSEPFAAGVAAFLFARVLRSLHGMHPDIRRYVAQGANALAVGERLELRHTGDAGLSLTRYYKIIEAKTARVFSCAAAVGALSVEAPRAQVRGLAEYGREVGLAFQIVDDLLDYTGETAALGKRRGADLRARKMTLPLIRLREALAGDERARQRLAAAVTQGREDEFPWIREQLARHEVVACCQRRAQEHVARALKSAGALPPGRGRAVLTELTDRLVTRRC